MKAWQWNGNAFETCHSVPLSDRGFRYGMSIFESLRVADSQPQHLEAHLSRLREACTARQLFCDEKALAAAARPLRECGLDGFARIYITAGDGAATSAAIDARVFLFIEPRERPALSSYDVELADEIHHPLFGGLKTGNYWANLDGLRRAQGRGKHEALLFNARAELVSACCANVFVVRDGVARTPALACGTRRGVIRELVMQRIPVEEAKLSKEDAMQADEIFLTNSWAGVMPVATLNGRALPSKAVAASLGTL
jgi:branched-subunit amino acid aminotransferase/4-amino-4-deoxychorismate lyase